VATRKPNEKPDLTPDAAAPPPGEPPDTIPIYGILGESGIADSVRLYLDRGMQTYYDIPIEGIAGREKIPADQSPLGVDSTLLFVQKGIRLVVHHTDTRTVEDEFLAGDFTAPGSFTPAPGGPEPGGGLPGGGIGIPASELCATNIACDTVLGCGVVGPRTIATVCSQIGCPTQLLGCQTQTAATRCFSHIPGCGTNTAATVCFSRLPCNIATQAATICRPSLGIACTIQGCNPCIGHTIRPTTFTQLNFCGGTCVAHTIHPTIWTQIDCQIVSANCPVHTGVNCPPSGFGPCPSAVCGGFPGGGGDPGPEF
jgi:hypothetical protein